MSESSAPEKDNVEVEAKSRRPRRLSVWWWLRAAVWVIGAPFVMVLIAAVMLIGREVTAPSWIVRDVEHRAAQVLAGGSIDFGAMRFSVGNDLHPRLLLQNAVLRDAGGDVLARVPRIEGLISPRGVLQGRVLAQEVRLRGAQISLRRAKDGTVALAFDQGAATVGVADGFVGLLEQIDQVFEEGALEALEQLRAEGLIINYVDARAGRSWVIDDGRIELDVRDGDLQLRADVALLSGRAYVTTAGLTYESLRGSRSAEIGLSITDAAARDIASQSPLLAWLGVLDAPISGSVRGQLGPDGELATVSTALHIGEGELQPNSQTRPIPFSSARTYLNYDPALEKLTFDVLEVSSELGQVTGTAQTYLREFEDGWPLALLGQIQLSEMSIAPEVIFDDPIDIAQADLDFRLRLDPFTLDIGQAVIESGDVPISVKGRISAIADGWLVSLDASAERIFTEQVIALWPSNVGSRTRDWLKEFVRAGELHDTTAAFRARPDTEPTFALSSEFHGATVGFIRNIPPIEDADGVLSIVDRRLALSLEDGHVTAPEGGRIVLSGSSMVIPRTGIPNPPARFDLQLVGGVTAAMAVLNLEPFNVLRSSELPVSFAQGRARISALIETPLGRGVTPDERVWSADARVRDVRSTVLVPNQTLTASELRVQVNSESLLVSGPMQLGDFGGAATFSRALGAGSEGTARVEANVTIGPAFLKAFNINLPDGMVSGQADAQIVINLSDPNAASFRLTSDLRGMGLSLSGVGWSKARNAVGALTVVGQLGATPKIDQLSISAPGLQTTGTIQLAAGGGLERAAFESVRLGGWLDAPVVLLGRGAGRPVQVQIAGGSLDLRSANFGEGGTGANEGAPLDIALDRLVITDSIQLDNFRGTFTSPAGLQGEFQGDLNGTAPIRGTLVPINGRSAVRIVSDDAGGVFRATRLLRNAFGGAMELTLIPAGSEGSYDGMLNGNNVRVRDAPALASLLDAISVVGLLTQLDGQGLLFTDVDAKFRLTPSQVIVTQSSATGPGLGISLDGVYSQAQQTMDFQGVVSPFYLLNGVGAILTRPGEGLIGFNFNLRGPVDNPQVLVNPLSALTPGMFRDIFRRAPPTVDQ